MTKRPGRNDLCPCRSGLKYKHCHLKRVNEAPAENLDEALNAASEAVTSQDPQEQRGGMDALERLRLRADLTPHQRTAVGLNFAAGLRFQRCHRDALSILGRLCGDSADDPRLALWLALKTGASRAVLGNVEAASECFEDALAAKSGTDDLRLLGGIALEAGKVREQLGDVEGASRL